MARIWHFALAATLLAPSWPAMADEPEPAPCTFNGIKLFGRVKVVESFPDLEIQAVSSFPDLKVLPVNSFPDSCGKWQFVESFPDFTVKFVSSFPDIKVQFVESFPGEP